MFGIFFGVKRVVDNSGNHRDLVISTSDVVGLFTMREKKIGSRGLDDTLGEFFTGAGSSSCLGN